MTAIPDDINNPAPTPDPSRAVLNATAADNAEYLEDLAQPNGALWHSPLDRARILVIARQLRHADGPRLTYYPYD